MPITILALGSHGEVQPFVLLGAALREAGHRVRVAAIGAFAPMIQEARLEFAPKPGCRKPSKSFKTCNEVEITTDGPLLQAGLILF